jgi:hypothetical protein
MITTTMSFCVTVPLQLLKMVSRRNRSSVQPNKQESTEGHRGNNKFLVFHLAKAMIRSYLNDEL